MFYILNFYNHCHHYTKCYGNDFFNIIILILCLVPIIYLLIYTNSEVTRIRTIESNQLFIKKSMIRLKNHQYFLKIYLKYKTKQFKT